MLQRLKVGDEIAILPEEHSHDRTVQEITSIGVAGTGFIQLIDGRMYSSTDGRCMGSSHGGYAVPASDVHRAALMNRRTRYPNQ